MRSVRVLKAELARMIAALAVIEAHHRRVWERLEVQAEDTVVSVRPKQRQYGRGRTTWTDADEREYVRQLQRLEAAHRGELVALARKAARQRAAIADFHARHRFNEPLDLGNSVAAPLALGRRRQGRDRAKSGPGERLPGLPI